MTSISKIPTDLGRPLKNIELENQELVKLSQKQVELLEKQNPVEPLSLASNLIVSYGTTTEGAVVGPYNLPQYSNLTGYLKEPNEAVILRAEYRDGAYPAGNFVYQRVWNMSWNVGFYSQFNLPMIAPFVRLKYQGLSSPGHVSTTLLANNIPTPIEFKASETPLLQFLQTFNAGENATRYISDLVAGPINYTFRASAGGSAVAVLFTALTPTFEATYLNELKLAAGGIQSGTIYLPPSPCWVTLYNTGSGSQTLVFTLWQ